MYRRTFKIVKELNRDGEEAEKNEDERITNGRGRNEIKPKNSICSSSYST